MTEGRVAILACAYLSGFFWSITWILKCIIYHANSEFVSLGRTKPIRQSEGLGGMESIEHVSGEYGRMKSNLAHIDFAAGILITPAHSRCFKYDMKSWNCKKIRKFNHFGSGQARQLRDYYERKRLLLNWIASFYTGFLLNCEVHPNLKSSAPRKKREIKLEIFVFST